MKLPLYLGEKTIDKLEKLGAITDTYEYEKLPLKDKTKIIYTGLDRSGTRMVYMKGNHFIDRLHHWFIIDLSKIGGT